MNKEDDMKATKTLIELYEAACDELVALETGNFPTARDTRAKALERVEHLKRVLKAVDLKGTIHLA